MNPSISSTYVHLKSSVKFFAITQRSQTVLEFYEMENKENEMLSLVLEFHKNEKYNLP